MRGKPTYIKLLVDAFGFESGSVLSARVKTVGASLVIALIKVKGRVRHIARDRLETKGGPLQTYDMWIEQTWVELSPLEQLAMQAE